MSKGTEVPVLTTHHRVYRVTCRVGRAEFRFVLVRMVELLHAVVRIGAVVSIRTFLPRSYYLAQFGCVEMRQSTAILVAVVVWDVAKELTAALNKLAEAIIRISEVYTGG